MKQLSTRMRWVLLLGLLAATTAAALFEPAQEGAVTQAVAARKNVPHDTLRREAGSPALAGLYLDKLKRSPAQKKHEAEELFQTRSWYVAPPPTKPAPPLPPSPPPLPFAYMGKMLEDGKLVVFLNRQDKNFVVKEGDVVAGNYRVEKIQPQLMTLTYLPLNMQQTLIMGASN